jgi:hypothetical protein
LEKIGWATFWAIFAQTHQVALPSPLSRLLFVAVEISNKDSLFACSKGTHRINGFTRTGGGIACFFTSKSSRADAQLTKSVI